MISFKQFLREGGWSKTITQGVKLTPAVAKKAVALLPKFEKDFNQFLDSRGHPRVKIGKPVGSSAYIDRDLKADPDKEYGDIDVILHIPRLPDMSDAQINGLYSKELIDFVAHSDHPYLYKDADNGGQNIIVKVGDDWVQVDMVKAIGELGDWVQHRMTPEHGLKGALIGTLYSALADVLHLSIGSSGVQAKEKGGAFVPFRTVKVDKTHTITIHIDTFALDILKVFFQRAKRDTKMVVSQTTQKHPGINKSEIKASDVAMAIKGLGRSLAQNGLFGEGDLKNIPDYNSFIDKIKKVYLEKLEAASKSSKFDKAETPAAIKKAAETKDLLLNKSKQVAQLLD